MGAIMGGAATARERQAALRARRRKNNLNYIHGWANADQEQAIKAFLADPIANPLHVTASPVEIGDGNHAVNHLDQVIRCNEMHRREMDLANQEARLQVLSSELDQRTARLERLEASTEDKHRTYRAWLASIKECQAAIQERDEKLNVLELDLKDASTRLMRDHDTKKLSDKARTETLVQRFTTERDYRHAGEIFKPIGDDWKIKQRVQEISKLTARTKTVRTSLPTLVREFKDILGENESDDLNDASGVLLHISNAADITLKRARVLETKLIEEEEKRQAVAYKAATTYLLGLGDAEQVMRLCILDPHSYYELDRFLAGEASYLSDVKRHVQSAVVYQIKDALKAGKNLDQSLVSLEKLVTEKMSKAKDTYGRQVEVAIAAVVAERLAKANG